MTRNQIAAAEAHVRKCHLSCRTPAATNRSDAAILVSAATSNWSVNGSNIESRVRIVVHANAANKMMVAANAQAIETRFRSKASNTAFNLILNLDCACSADDMVHSQ